MDKIATVKNKVKYAEWITMVEDCRNSGLPVRVWCKEYFVGYKTYYYRLRKLRSMFIEEHKEDLIPEIAPLPVVPQQAIELIHKRRKKSSTVFCSQFLDDGWYERIGSEDNPLSDSIMD